MSLPSDPNLSITAADIPRAREEVPPIPALFIVGDSEGISPETETRVLTFGASLHVGRRAPRNNADQAWVVRDQLVSSQHCLIARQGDGYFLTDLGSRNGTVVDGLLVKEPEPVRLRDGAIIFLGTQIAVFHYVSNNAIEAIRAELRDPLGPVSTASPELALTCRMLRKLALSDSELLLTGETGVGKEVYARAIHDASGRKGPFIPVNCAALPRELVESELFGYVRGAHSQARDNKRGLFEEAESGTIFLDEVGEMSPDLQSKLLRFLQDREVMPLGATRGRRLDVRVLAATNRAAPPVGSAGLGLRADLAARLGAEPIRLPPLRHRLEDLGVLASHFLRDRACRFEAPAFQALALHNWPGNVRELQKVLDNAELLARDSDGIGLEHLPSAIASGPVRLKSSPPGSAARPPPPTGPELEGLLRRFHGNVQRVARELGRTPPLIYRWCRRYKLDPDTFRPRD